MHRALEHAEGEADGTALADGAVHQFVRDVDLRLHAAHLGAGRRAEGAHDEVRLVLANGRLDGLHGTRLGEAGAPLHPRIESEIANHMSYVEGALAGRDYLLGSEPTGADVQMSFIPEVLKAFGKLDAYPNMAAWIERIHARPAWKAGLDKGGPYALGR
jgi:glutathione S-transferase